MNSRAKASRPILVTFSGPEGAGKTTQKKFVVGFLEAAGLATHTMHTSRLALSYLVLRVVYKTGLRRAKPRELKLDDGRSDHPSEMQDVSSLPTRRTGGVRNGGYRKAWVGVRRVRRAVVYLLDALILRIVLSLPRSRRFNAVVCDRYMYDAMARIVDTNPRAVRLVSKLMPTPDLAIVLRAEIEHHSLKRERSSPEYFVERYRQYSRLQQLCCPELVSVGPGDLKSIQCEIEQRLREVLKARQEMVGPATLPPVSG